ncbi:MAG TPA: nuclear transport factor 2 family protein [Chloroflexota bacterium]
MTRARWFALIVTFGVALVLSAGTGGYLPAARAQAPRQASALAVVATYFNAFNAGMQNGNFERLRSIYAPNGVLTQSNPLGESKVSHGIVQIIAFYQAAYARFHGYHWIQDSTRLLSKNVVLNYEFARSPTLPEPGRCAHIFVIKNGKISTLDWITFYSGHT